MDNLVLIGAIVLVGLLLVGAIVAFRDQARSMPNPEALDDAMINLLTRAKELVEWHERDSELENLRTNPEQMNLSSEEQKEQFYQQSIAHMQQYTALIQHYSDAWLKAYERSMLHEPWLRSLLMRVSPAHFENVSYATVIADQWLSNPEVIRRGIMTWESLRGESDG